MDVIDSVQVERMLEETLRVYKRLGVIVNNTGIGPTNVAVDAVLSWRAGREAASHDVYLSTDQQAVIDGTASVAKVTTASYAPALEIERTYYWKVNEVNEAEVPSVWEGSVWSFSTPQYVVVDDFETYDDEEGKGTRIYETWIDGFGTATNGAQVGYAQAPFAEKTIIHGGKQSMPLRYDNRTASYSEGERTFDVPQDWTRAGVKTLVLYLYGTSGNTGQLYVKVNGSKAVYGGNAADIARPRWKQWNIDLVSLGVSLQNVTSLSIGVDGVGAKGIVLIDDILLYRSAPAVPSEEIWIEAEAADTISAPLLIMSDVAGTSGGQYIMVETGNNSTGEPPASDIFSFVDPNLSHNSLYRNF